MLRFTFVLLLFVSFTFNTSFGQNKSIVSISGYAPDYVGKTIELFEIEDYLSQKEVLIASTTVLADSTFSIYFYSNKKVHHSL